MYGAKLRAPHSKAAQAYMHHSWTWQLGLGLQECPDSPTSALEAPCHGQGSPHGVPQLLAAQSGAGVCLPPAPSLTRT